jgi:hypothetical protein
MLAEDPLRSGLPSPTSASLRLSDQDAVRRCGAPARFTPDKLLKNRGKRLGSEDICPQHDVKHQKNDRLVALFSFSYCFLYANGLIVLHNETNVPPLTEPDTQLHRTRFSVAKADSPGNRSLGQVHRF